MDVGFEFDAGPAERECAFLEYAAHGLEGAAQVIGDDRQGVVENETVAAALDPVAVLAACLLVERKGAALAFEALFKFRCDA